MLEYIFLGKFTLSVAYVLKTLKNAYFLEIFNKLYDMK